MTRVSIVVLSYNRPALLAEALPAALAEAGPDDEVIVVDNPSAAARDIDAVLARCPRARLVRPDANLGFAGGMNRGLRAAGGEWVLLSEDDIVIGPGTVEALRAHLAADPACGIATAVMVDHGSGALRFGGSQVELGAVFRQQVVSGDNLPLPGEPFAVAFAPGACVFARRDFLLRLGGFRDDFFMYFEDLELCLRVREAGRAVHLVPSATVAHFEPPAGTPPAWLEFHKMKNLAALYLLHAAAAAMPGFAIRYGLWLPLRTAFVAPARAAALVRGWLWALRRAGRLRRERRERRRALYSPA